MNIIIFKIIRVFLPFKSWRTAAKFWFIFYPHLKNSCHICQNINKLRKKGTKFPHPVGIVIGHRVEIGNNCYIYQNVSLVNSFNPKTEGQPILKDNAKIYSNSVVMGKVTIGENSMVGAGSLVRKDIPDNEVWAGNPAKFIKKIKAK